jgi:putative transposase
MLDPLVFERGGRFWLAMSFEIPNPPHDPRTCVGVDLGKRRLAVTSEGVIFKSNDFLRIKRRIRHNRRMMQSKKGRSHSARRKLKADGRRERNFSKNEMHSLANSVLESTKADVIVLEDLTGIKGNTCNQGRRHNNMLSQIPLYMFRTILTYKAPTLGKRVETVNPAYTSQDDYRGLPRGVRKGCRYYASDGVQLDADHNAAVNIAKKWSKASHLPASFSAPNRGCQTLRAGRVNRPTVGALGLQAQQF